jgi:hypothetical protein
MVNFLLRKKNLYIIYYSISLLPGASFLPYVWILHRDDNSKTRRNAHQVDRSRGGEPAAQKRAKRFFFFEKMYQIFG